MRMGVAQLAIPPQQTRDVTHQVQAAAVADLFEQGADLVLLPECASHKYGLESAGEVATLAETLQGDTVTLWARWARQHQGYLVGGLLERDGPHLYNTAVVVGPTGYVGHYRKRHRFGWEQQWLEAGDRMALVHIRSLDLTMGILICYDLRFGDMVASLAEAGADLVAVPTTWTSIGKTVLWDRAGYTPQNHLALGHAYAHRVFVACADRVGQEGGVTYLGSSIVAGPDGDAILGPMSGTKPEIGVVEMDFARARSKKVGTSDLREDRRTLPTPPIHLIDVE